VALYGEDGRQAAGMIPKIDARVFQGDQVVGDN
jgi:hypothetical protein